MAEASGIRGALAAIPKFGGNGSRTWDKPNRTEVSLYAGKLPELLAGALCPAATSTNADEVAKGHRNNARLYSIMFLATDGSTCTTVKQQKALPTAGVKVDGVATWAAFAARYNGNTKEAHRACPEKLLHASMKSARGPTNFIMEIEDL